MVAHFTQEMRFDDGDSPPEAIIEAWLALVNQRFANAKSDDPNGPCIAVHCVAGLGRYVTYTTYTLGPS